MKKKKQKEKESLRIKRLKAKNRRDIGYSMVDLLPLSLSISKKLNKK
jgi:hypothetical protein